MREHGKYIDAQDIEDHLRLCMQRYLDEAGKVEGEGGGGLGAKTSERVRHVREELNRLRDPLTRNSA